MRLPNDLANVEPTVPLCLEDGVAFMCGFKLVGPLARTRMRLPDALDGDLLNLTNIVLSGKSSLQNFFTADDAKLPVRPDGTVAIFERTTRRSISLCPSRL